MAYIAAHLDAVVSAGVRSIRHSPPPPGISVPAMTCPEQQSVNSASNTNDEGCRKDVPNRPLHSLLTSLHCGLSVFGPGRGRFWQFLATDFDRSLLLW